MAGRLMSTNLLSMNSLSPGRDLASYVQTVGAFPILSAEEEKAPPAEE